MIPSYSFAQPWDRLNGRCKIEMGGRVYDVVRWTAPVRIVRFTARLDGVVVAERAKFTALLRDLGKQTGC
jgi:hypothetical protein